MTNLYQGKRTCLLKPVGHQIFTVLSTVDVGMRIKPRGGGGLLQLDRIGLFMTQALT